MAGGSCRPIRVKTRLLRKKTTTSHMPNVCWRVSADRTVCPAKERHRPTAITASTPDTPSQSASP